MPEYSRPRYTERRADLCRVTILWITLAAAGFEMLAVFKEQIVRLSVGDDLSGGGPLMLILFLGAFSADSFRGLPLAMRQVRPNFVAVMAGLAAFSAVMVCGRCLNMARQERPGPEQCPSWLPSWS